MMRASSLLSLLCLLPWGCEEPPKLSPKEQAEARAAEGVDLKGGTKHDPPLAKSEVPAGHWYCDMGTVHYSRAEEGDGKCPLCAMDLVQADE